jgi:hypothetical protein
MSRLYATALGDLALLIFSLMADIDPVLRMIGLIVGLVVGVFTLAKLYYDIRLKRIEIDLKKKELEK